MSIIISKPNKSLCDTSKKFQPIILLNMIEKPIEKVISSELGVYSITLNFIYLNQIENIKQWSATDASIYIIYFIWAGWIKRLYICTLAFDITYFFSSYLINRQTQYVWNHFIFLFFKANIDVDQESAFSPILSAFYIASIFHVFEKRSKTLLTPILVLFLDNGFFVS